MKQAIATRAVVRNYSAPLSPRECASLLQALARTQGQIKDTYSYCPKDAIVHKQTMFYRLRWPTMAHLQAFHKLGFKTEPVPLNKTPELACDGYPDW